MKFDSRHARFYRAAYNLDSRVDMPGYALTYWRKLFLAVLSLIFAPIGWIVHFFTPVSMLDKFFWTYLPALSLVMVWSLGRLTTEVVMGAPQAWHFEFLLGAGEALLWGLMWTAWYYTTEHLSKKKDAELDERVEALRSKFYSPIDWE